MYALEYKTEKSGWVELSRHYNAAEAGDAFKQAVISDAPVNYPYLYRIIIATGE